MTRQLSHATRAMLAESPPMPGQMLVAVRASS